MQLNEFMSVSDYVKSLKEQTKEKKDKEKSKQLWDGNVSKSKEFASLIPLIIEKHKKAKVRDLLEHDGTFAILFKKEEGPGFIEAISLYEDIRDITKVTTYAQIKNMGFIDLEDYEGFWVLLGWNR